MSSKNRTLLNRLDYGTEFDPALSISTKLAEITASQGDPSILSSDPQNEAGEKIACTELYSGINGNSAVRGCTANLSRGEGEKSAVEGCRAELAGAGVENRLCAAVQRNFMRKVGERAAGAGEAAGMTLPDGLTLRNPAYTLIKAAMAPPPQTGPIAQMQPVQHAQRVTPMQSTMPNQLGTQQFMAQQPGMAGSGQLNNGLASRVPNQAANMPGIAGSAAANPLDTYGALSNSPNAPVDGNSALNAPTGFKMGSALTGGLVGAGLGAAAGGLGDYLWADEDEPDSIWDGVLGGGLAGGLAGGLGGAIYAGRPSAKAPFNMSTYRDQENARLHSRPARPSPREAHPQQEAPLASRLDMLQKEDLRKFQANEAGAHYPLEGRPVKGETSTERMADALRGTAREPVQVSNKDILPEGYLRQARPRALDYRLNNMNIPFNEPIDDASLSRKIPVTGKDGPGSGTFYAPGEGLPQYERSLWDRVRGNYGPAADYVKVTPSGRPRIDRSSLNHEMVHAMQIPPKGESRYDADPVMWESMRKFPELVRSGAGSSSPPKFTAEDVPSGAGNSSLGHYPAMRDEVEARLAALKREHFRRTGEVIFTPEQALKVLQEAGNTRDAASVRQFSVPEVDKLLPLDRENPEYPTLLKRLSEIMPGLVGINLDGASKTAAELGRRAAKLACSDSKPVRYSKPARTWKKVKRKRATPGK